MARARHKPGHRILINDPLEFAAKRGKYLAGCSVDDTYTADEVVFLRAMNAYKVKYQRPNPTCCEVLAVLLSLGYRKVETE